MTAEAALFSRWPSSAPWIKAATACVAAHTTRNLPSGLSTFGSLRLICYEDVKDAERLSQDPTFWLIGSEKIWERGTALTSRLQSFETELLTEG